jgi:glycosyltransferase involved in cell wall biosynthesis
MERKRIIGVDLIPMRADGSNGGVKPAIIEFLKSIQVVKDAQVGFIYFCNSQTQHEIRNFCRADDLTICVFKLDNVEPVSADLLTENDFDRIGLQDNSLIEFPVDLLYAPFGNTDLNYPGVPLVTTIVDLLHKDYPHSISNEETLHREEFISNMIERSELIQVISGYTKNRLIHHYKVEEDRVFTSYLPIHKRLSKKFKSNVSPIDRPYFFYPANFWIHKNHEILLIAFFNYLKNVESEPWRLVLTGHNSDRKGKIIEYSKSLGLTNDAVFLEYLSERDLENYWQHAGALLFPSLHEGFGIPLLEAMHYQVPIIAHEGSSLPEVGQDACRYCNCKNPLELASAMKDITEKEDLRSSLVRRGTSRLLDFQFDEIAESLGSRLIEYSTKPSRHLSQLGIYKDGWMGKRAIFNVPESLGRSQIKIELFPVPVGRFVSLFLNGMPFGSYDLAIGAECELSFNAFLNGEILMIESNEVSRLNPEDPRSFGVRIRSISITSEDQSNITLWRAK